MSSQVAKNPNGGATMRRVTEEPDPNVNSYVFDRHELLVSVKELWVNIHYPATARFVL
jgi:hypothetical protein